VLRTVAAVPRLRRRVRDSRPGRIDGPPAKPWAARMGKTKKAGEADPLQALQLQRLLTS